MAISGYLVPFPDPGAADLLSDHLEQEVHAAGAGKILIKISLPLTLQKGGSPSSSSNGYARKMLEILKKEGDDWVLLWDATTDSDAALEEVSWDIPSSGILKCRLTNMSGAEGQFSLQCMHVPA